MSKQVRKNIGKRKAAGNGRMDCGSLTVEAAFLMPLILAVLVILVYLSFFLHNKTVAAAVIQDAARSAAGEQLEENIYQIAEGLTDVGMRERLLGVSKPRTEVLVDKEQVKITCWIDFQIPEGFWTQLLPGQTKWQIKISGSAKRLKPVEFIRKQRQLEGLISE